MVARGEEGGRVTGGVVERLVEVDAPREVVTRLGVPATRCVFLDDIGRNLKPAQALGMRTIKCSLEDSTGATALGALAHELRGNRPLASQLRNLLRRARL